MPNLEKYIFEGSPFLLPPLSARAMLSIRASASLMSIPYAGALNLLEYFRKHIGNLKSNLKELAQFGTTIGDLECYKLGFIAPLLVIRISIEEESHPSIREIILSSSQHEWGYTEHYSSFLNDKINKCTQFRKQGIWEKIFSITSTYSFHLADGSPDYYLVGGIAAAAAFKQFTT